MKSNGNQEQSHQQAKQPKKNKNEMKTTIILLGYKIETSRLNTHTETTQPQDHWQRQVESKSKANNSNN